jgi:hypothetical protein
MVDLRKKRVRHIEICYKYSKLYSHSNQREQQVVSSGVLNYIWNSWNTFWRDYLICHISGGYNLKHRKIDGIYPEYNDYQSCHFLLYKLGKRKRHNYGEAITGSFQEATWGDPKTIEDLAYHLISDYPEMTNLLGVLSSYQNEIKHFQQIRNTFIHLNRNNILSLNSIRGYYIFANQQKLIDILDSQSITTKIKCFDHLNENMKGLLLTL